MFRWNALDHAEEYKSIALKTAARGGNTVRVFETTAHMHKRADACPNRRAVAELKSGWQFAKGEAIEAFRFAVHGTGLVAPGFGDL